MEVRMLCPLDFRDISHKSNIALPYAWGAHVNDLDYVAPRGMVSDGASTPWFVWMFMPPLYGKYRPAAILHDAAYKDLLRATGPGTGSLPIERSEADLLFYFVCKWNGVPEAKARLAYLAVSKFGLPAWKKEHRKYAKLDRNKLDYKIVKRPTTYLLTDLIQGSHPEFLAQGV